MMTEHDPAVIEVHDAIARGDDLVRDLRYIAYRHQRHLHGVPAERLAAYFPAEFEVRYQQEVAE